MTYRPHVGADPNAPAAQEFSWSQSLMMLDIAALQYMYGANFNTNAGNTVYTFNSTTGEMLIDGVGQGQPGGNRVVRTIWDGNGIDTYDFSNYADGINVDLSPGGWSTISQTQIARLNQDGSQLARANVFNALQFNNDNRSLIENANGGNGNDTLTGNSTNNTLIGGAGNDMLNGGTGNDTLNGGDDTDTASYANRTQAVVANLGSGVAQIASLNETDTLVSIENFTGGSGNDRVFGSNDVNILIGGAGEDLLAGLNGADELFGGLNNDSLSGGDGNDMLEGGEGDDRLFGNNDNDTINGGAGDDLINGGNGDDIINGGGDDDNALVGGNDNDTIHGDGGNDGINGSAGNDVLFGDDGNDRLFGGSGDDTINGGANDDTLGGLGDTDILNGDAGEDGLNGGGGNDTLNGGADIDRLFGGTGDDTLNGGTGDDLLFGQVGLDTYVFEANWGNDLIVRYGDVNGGTSARVDEVIDLSALGVTFADVNIAQQGNSTLITVNGHAGNSIELNFTNVATITESDFDFTV